MRRIALDRNRERGVGAGNPRRQPGSQRCGVGACARARWRSLRTPAPGPGAQSATRAARRATRAGEWPDGCTGQDRRMQAIMEEGCRSLCSGAQRQADGGRAAAPVNLSSVLRLERSGSRP